MSNYISFTISGMLSIQRNHLVAYALSGMQDHSQPNLQQLSIDLHQPVEGLGPDQNSVVFFTAFQGKAGKWRVMTRCMDVGKRDELLSHPEVRSHLKQLVYSVGEQHSPYKGWLDCHVFGSATVTTNSTKAYGFAIQPDPFGQATEHSINVSHDQPLMIANTAVILFMIQKKSKGQVSPTVVAALNGEVFGGNLAAFTSLKPALDQLIEKF